MHRRPGPDNAEESAIPTRLIDGNPRKHDTQPTGFCSGFRLVCRWHRRWRCRSHASCPRRRDDRDAREVTHRYPTHSRRLHAVPRRWEAPRNYRRGALRDAVAQHATPGDQRTAAPGSRNVSSRQSKSGPCVLRTVRRHLFAVRRCRTRPSGDCVGSAGHFDPEERPGCACCRRGDSLPGHAQGGRSDQAPPVRARWSP